MWEVNLQKNKKCKPWVVQNNTFLICTPDFWYVAAYRKKKKSFRKLYFLLWLTKVPWLFTVFFYVWIKRAYLSICVAQLLKAVNYNQWQLTIIETIVVTSIIAAIWWKTVCTLWAVPVQYAGISDTFTVNNLLGWTWAIIYWNKIVMEMS